MRLKITFAIVQPDGQRTVHIARSGVLQSVARIAGAEQHGQTGLKQIMGIICMSRPDLIPNKTLDFAVSVLDVKETDANAASAHGTASDVFPGKVWEGKGMMSWLLTEKAGQKVNGRIVSDPDPAGDGETLEMYAELMPVSYALAGSGSV